VTVLAWHAGQYVVADSAPASGRVYSRLLRGFSIDLKDIIPSE
jgi:hypothetical protein